MSQYSLHEPVCGLLHFHRQGISRFPQIGVVFLLFKRFVPPNRKLKISCTPSLGASSRVATPLDLDLAFGAVGVTDSLSCTSLLSPLLPLPPPIASPPSSAAAGEPIWDPGVFTVIIVFFPYWWLSYNKLFYLSIPHFVSISGQRTPPQPGREPCSAIEEPRVVPDHGGMPRFWALCSGSSAHYFFCCCDSRTQMHIRPKLGQMCID